MGTLTNGVISTTYKNIVFQKTDNKIYYTNSSDVDTEITTFASAMTLSGLITATLGIKLGNNIVYNSSAEACITLDVDQGVSLEASKVLYVDTVAEKTSANGVVIDSVTCKDGIVKLGSNVIQASDGGATITLDTSDNVTILGDLTVSGGDATLKAANDDGASLLMQADNSDDAGDDWNIRANADQTFTFGNDIASAGSFVNQFTITPHATVSSSYITVPGTIRTTKLEFTDGADAIDIGASGAVGVRGATTFYSSIALNTATNLSIATGETASLDIKQGGTSYLKFDTDATIITAGKLLLLDGNGGPANGAGIDSGSAPIRQYSWIEKLGSVIKTSIYVDLDGLASTTTDLDIIGLAAGGAAYIGAITSAVNGAIFAVKMTCLDTPTTGADEIDLWNADEATMVYDNPIESTSGTEHEIIKDSGAWTTGVTKGATHTITMGSTEYLYLTAGEAGTAAEYGKGKFLIELWGV